MSNNLRLLRLCSFSCTGVHVQHLGFYWHLPTSVYFLGSALTHQTQQKSWTTLWHFHRHSIRALGANLDSHCKMIFREFLELHRSYPLSLRACSVHHKAGVCRAPQGWQQTQCWKCIFINPEQHQVQPHEKHKCPLGGWKTASEHSPMYEPVR